MERAGSNPLFRPFGYAIVASLAHMCVDGPVPQSFGFECIVNQFFDGIANYTLYAHGGSLLFDSDR